MNVINGYMKYLKLNMFVLYFIKITTKPTWTNTP